MARADNMKNPTPTSGAARVTTDAVLTAFKIGNAMVSLLSGLLASVLILYSGYVLYDSFSTEYRAYSSSWDLLKYKPEVVNAEPSQGAETLAAINKDYRAWLTVYDTTIDYPVVQGENDLFYASHDIYQNVSLTGAIYLAAENARDFSDSYSLIYGHHMDNGAMFGSLDRFTKEDYFKTHQEGLLVTESGVYDLILFAAVSTDAYENRIYTVGNRAKEVLRFLTGDRGDDAGIGKAVLVYDEKTAKTAEKILALSTCADANTNGRLVLFARITEHPVSIPTKTPAETGKPSTKPSGKPTETKTPAPTAINKGKATPTPAAKQKEVVLTVRFVADDEPVFPEQKLIYPPGSSYYVVAPELPGYQTKTVIVQGTIEEDMTVIIRYVPVDYTLKIQYVFLDGTFAAQTYTQTLRIGDPYDIVSPEIKGFIPAKVRIRGTNPGRNESYSIVYIPVIGEDSPTLQDIGDYETPLNLDHVYIQTGVCVE